MEGETLKLHLERGADHRGESGMGRGYVWKKEEGSRDISGSPEDPKQSSDCLSIRGEEEEKVGEVEGAMETKPSCSASS